MVLTKASSLRFVEQNEQDSYGVHVLGGRSISICHCRQIRLLAYKIQKMSWRGLGRCVRCILTLWFLLISVNELSLQLDLIRRGRLFLVFFPKHFLALVSFYFKNGYAHLIFCKPFLNFQ